MDFPGRNQRRERDADRGDGSETHERDDAGDENRGEQQTEGQGGGGTHAATLPAAEFDRDGDRVGAVAVGEHNLIAFADAEFSGRRTTIEAHGKQTV